MQLVVETLIQSLPALCNVLLFGGFMVRAREGHAWGPGGGGNAA